MDAFVHEVSDQLSVLEDPHTQSERQFEAFQTMLRRQGNPILTATVERVKEGLNAHFVVARPHLDAIISGQLP